MIAAWVSLSVGTPATMPVAAGQPAGQPAGIGPSASCTVAVPCDIAIYDPAYEDDGVWEEEVVAFEHLLDAYGWTWQVISFSDLNQGQLGSPGAWRFKALLGPGGWSSIRKGDVVAAGDDHIRQFVADGMGYIGLCAGSYWASRKVTFAMNATGNSGNYNKSSDYHTWDYDLKLFKETAKGPFGWMPWDDGTNWNYSKVKIDTGKSTMADAGMPGTTRFVYGGGPFFTYEDKPSGLQIWGRAAAPSDTSDKADTGDGKPTIIRFLYGEGTVVLFSYHPDVLIGSDVDGVTLTQYINEADIPWDKGNQTQEQINIDSWNVVHAAIQKILHEPVTPVEALP